MKRLSILLLLLLGTLSTFAQIDQVKGTGIRNTSGKPTIDPPDLDISTEFALDVANRIVYIWNRVSEDWERQLHVTQASGAPSGDPGTGPKLYWDIDTGRVYRWTGSAWEELGTGSGSSYTSSQFRDSLASLSGVNRLDAAYIRNDTVSRMVNDSIIGYFVDGAEVGRDTFRTPGGGGGAVSSVNSQTGAVVLDADDVDDSATTNKFTTAGDISKLSGIESGATADQTATEIRDALETLTTSNRLDISAIDRIPLRDGVINRQTGNYVLVLADTTKVVEMNVGSSNTVTVPPQSSVGWPDNTYITISQYGAGATSVVAGSGVTIRSSADTLVSPGQYAPMVLKKIASDEWYLWNGTPAQATITGEALTKTDDTNVTATLTGSPSTALVNEANIALGWTGQLSAARGGTGSTAGAWLLTGTSILSGAATIAQATNQVNFLNGNILIGPTASTITASTKLDIRGTGTTTGNTIRTASSTNTETMTLTDGGNLTLAVGAMQVPVSVGYKLSGGGWTVKSGTVSSLTGITYTSTNYSGPHIFTSSTLGAADTHYRGMTLNFNWSPLPGTNEFTALNLTPSLGRNTAGGTRTATGIVYNPTINVEPDVHYGIRIVTKKAKNGFGVSAPTAAVHIRADTVNNNVLTYESEAASDNPTMTILQNRVATTNATLTTLHTLAIPASNTMLIKGFVVARRTGGTSGTAEDGAAYEFTAVYKNVAGTATVIGSTIITAVGEDQVGWDCQLNVSSGNVLIQVQGAADNNVTWHLSELKTMKVGS